MILVVVVTYILAGMGVPEAIALWNWFGSHLWITILMIIFLA